MMLQYDLNVIKGIIMKKVQSKVNRIWYKALLTPQATGIFTEAF